MGEQFDFKTELRGIPPRQLEIFVNFLVPELDQIGPLLRALRERLERAEDIEEIRFVSNGYMAAVTHVRRMAGAIPALDVPDETQALLDAHERLVYLFGSGISLLELLVQYQTFLDSCNEFELALFGQLQN